MLNEVDIHDILSQFPTISFAFAYGSGVVEQKGYDYSNVKGGDLPLVDLIFAVENAEEWHTLNRIMNPDHYTPLFPMSSKQIVNYQQNFGARIWYNTLIDSKLSRFPGRLMKYGIISKSDLIDDLLNWRYLYGAGRLQKPVQIFKSDNDVLSAVHINKTNAIRTSLLLLSPRFTEQDLYLAVASLSYVGDPRMIAGENPKKVLNLVTPVIQHYRSMYWNIFMKLKQGTFLDQDDFSQNGFDNNTPSSSNNNYFDSNLSSSYLSSSSSSFSVNSIPPPPTTSYDESTIRYYQNASKAARWNLALQLPFTLRNVLFMERRTRGLSRYHLFKEQPPTRSMIRTALVSIVGKSAMSQSMKGVLTAGVAKCSMYLLQKLKLSKYMNRSRFQF